MEDDRHTLRRSAAILARQKIAIENFNLRTAATAFVESLKRGRFTRRSDKAAQVVESKIQQAHHEPGANETCCPSHQNAVVPAYHKPAAFRLFHIATLIDDELTPNRPKANKSQESS